MVVDDLIRERPNQTSEGWEDRQKVRPSVGLPALQPAHVALALSPSQHQNHNMPQVAGSR